MGDELWSKNEHMAKKGGFNPYYLVVSKSSFSVVYYANNQHPGGSKGGGVD